MKITLKEKKIENVIKRVCVFIKGDVVEVRTTPSDLNVAIDSFLNNMDEKDYKKFDVVITVFDGSGQISYYKKGIEVIVISEWRKSVNIQIQNVPEDDRQRFLGMLNDDLKRFMLQE